MTRRTLIIAAALAVALAAAFLLAARAVRFGPDRRVVARVIAYNVQNLFDGSDHGREYAEFRASAGWGRDDYYERLERLSEAIRRTARGAGDRRLRSASAGVAAGARGGSGPGGALPDIVVLCEVESAWVAADLARDFLRRYRWVSGAPEPGRAFPDGEPSTAAVRLGGPGDAARATAPTRVAVLSRRRPELRSHRAVEIDLVPGAGARARWRGRETLELRFASRGLRLFAAHWKSQSGGERETEPRRILEAALVHDLIRASESLAAAYPATLLVGDLNEGLYEARQHDGAWPTAIVPWRPGEGGRWPHSSNAEAPAARIRFVAPDAPPPDTDGPVWRTLWHDTAHPGTYWYRGEWERLDHAFLLADEEYGGRIDVGRWQELLEPDGTPARYDPRRGRGYSDHLPIRVTVTRRRAP